MKTRVKTNLTIGSTKRIYFGDNQEHSISMHDNPFFEKDYDCVEDFLKEFSPNNPSDNLISRIKEEFNKIGEITYKPKGYKANQKFYFSK